VDSFKEEEVEARETAFPMLDGRLSFVYCLLKMSWSDVLLDLLSCFGDSLSVRFGGIKKQ